MRKSTRESTTYFSRGLVCRWNIQKMQSESDEYVRKSTGFFTNSWKNKRRATLTSTVRKFGMESDES